MGKNSVMNSVCRSRKMCNISLRATDSMRCQEPLENMRPPRCTYPGRTPSSFPRGAWERGSRGRGEGGTAGGFSLFFCLAPVQGRLDEAPEQRVRGRRLRLELGVALHRDEPRMIRQLDHLGQLAV